jgi:uncharacterized protein (TIGR03437 family)
MYTEGIMRFASVLLLMSAAASFARADLLVSSRDTLNVLDYDEKTGAYIGVFNKGGNLMGPEALTFGPDGNLYVADRVSNTVVSFDGKTGAFLKNFVAAGSGGLAGPRDLAFGPDGELYVSSNDNDEVLVYDGTTGAFLRVFVKTPNLSPRGIAFQNGNLFLSSENMNQVLQYSLSGTLLGVFANDSTISSPREIVFGADGNLYLSMVASGPATNGVLQINGTTGALIRVFANTGLNYPRGLAFGPDGNLYVANGDGNDVVRFSGSTGVYMDIFSNGGVLSFPSGVAFTPRVVPPPPTINSAVNGASFVSGISPGALATIFGKNLSSAQGVVLASSAPLPLELLTTSVTIGGIPAPIDVVANVNGQEQINLQVPLEVTGSSAAVVVTNNAIASQPLTVNVLPAQPGIFTSDGTDAAVLHGVNNAAISSASPAAPGETIVIFATGLGPVSPALPTNTPAPGSPHSNSVLTTGVSMAGESAVVAFSGLAPGFIALWQVNAVVPMDAATGNLDLIVTVNNVASNTTKFPVKR